MNLGADGESISGPQTLPELIDPDTVPSGQAEGWNAPAVVPMFLTESIRPHLVAAGVAQ